MASVRKKRRTSGPNFAPRMGDELSSRRKASGTPAGETGGSRWLSSRILSSAKPQHKVLSRAQRRVLELAVKERLNVFFTGGAGTGKTTTLLRMVVELEREHGLYGKVFCVAPTGLAAWGLGGTTIHSFAGVRNSDSTLDEMLDEIQDNEHAISRWQTCQVLIWDEISMVDSVFLEKLDAIARSIRQTPLAPFGGIQLVVSGDFFQLPPIGLGLDAGWAFLSPLWNQLFDVHILLKTSHRQHGEYLRLLNEIRTGEMPADTVSRLLSLSRKHGSQGLKCTRIFATKREVDAENQRCLEALGEDAGPTVTFVANDMHVGKSAGNLMHGCPAQREVSLRVGAEVILLKNLDLSAGLVNGCRGVVMSFTKAKSPLPIVHFRIGNSVKQVLSRTIHRANWELKSGSKIIASRNQIPLQLAYALTVHKCQGQTLSNIYVDFRSRAFTSGQAYVALSRTADIQNLAIGKLSATDVKVSDKVVKFYKEVFGAVA